MAVYIISIFFFFQAEDGIRDVAVTGVQTCALPIWYPSRRERRQGRGLHCAARTAGRDRGSRGAGADRDSVRAGLQRGWARALRPLEPAEPERPRRDRLAHHRAEPQSQPRPHQGGYTRNALPPWADPPLLPPGARRP